MTINDQFSDIVSLLAASDLAARERKALEERLDAEGIAGASSAFQETKQFLEALESALKAGVDPMITLAMDYQWVPSNGRDYYMLCYKLWKPSRGENELWFHVTGDFQRIEFESHDFALTDTTGIQNAIKAWVVAKLH
ncbi:MAG: hypothetical protein WA418_35680 [Bradyrhizobium sp.]